MGGDMICTQKFCCRLPRISLASLVKISMLHFSWCVQTTKLYRLSSLAPTLSARWGMRQKKLFLQLYWRLKLLLAWGRAAARWFPQGRVQRGVQRGGDGAEAKRHRARAGPPLSGAGRQVCCKTCQTKIVINIENNYVEKIWMVGNAPSNNNISGPSLVLKWPCAAQPACFLS